MCTIRGTLKNRVWINTVRFILWLHFSILPYFPHLSINLTSIQGDIILVGLREFGDDKADVILKYYDEEAKELKELGEIPEHVKINEGNLDFDEDGFNYGDDDEEEKEEDINIDTVSLSIMMI